MNRKIHLEHVENDFYLNFNNCTETKCCTRKILFSCLREWRHTLHMYSCFELCKWKGQREYVHHFLAFLNRETNCASIPLIQNYTLVCKNWNTEMFTNLSNFFIFLLQGTYNKLHCLHVCLNWVSLKEIYYKIFILSRYICELAIRKFASYMSSKVFNI